MIAVNMPDGREFSFKRVVFDYNGTLAEDGKITPPVKALLVQLAQAIPVTVITADTFGLARSQLQDLSGVELVILGPDMGGSEKAAYVMEQGAGHVIAIGNGANDRQMFIVAGLAICVNGPEGAARETLGVADIVVTKPEDAIRLLLQPKRLIATLRL